MVYGYARVSSYGQYKDGFGLDAQIKSLKDAGAEVIYQDVFTGTKIDRPEFNKLLQELTEGDTLIVVKLDRIARSVSQASDLITQLIDKGITINVLNLGVLSNDSVSTLLRNVLLSFAQFERDMIVERTTEGKAIARLNPDFKEGRPQLYDDEKIAYALKLLETNSYTKVTKLTGISKSTLIRAQQIKYKIIPVTILNDGTVVEGKRKETYYSKQDLSIGGLYSLREGKLYRVLEKNTPPT